MRAHGFSLFVALVIGACGGGRTQIAIGDPPPRMTRAALAGPLCNNGACKCRQGETDAGFPDDPKRKRYELKLLSPYELWLTLPGGSVLYKNPERAAECFYVDYAAGEQPMELRASNASGVAFGIEVHELGAKTKSAYDTFKFSCGNPGACSFEELEIVRGDLAKVKSNLHDPCGSTKIKGVVWDHGKAPDQQHPSEFVLRFTLDIRKFAPWKAHGDPKCGPGMGRPPKDDGSPDPEPDPDAEPKP